MFKYKVLGVAGEGQYGTVYRAHVKGTGQQVAIKKFKLGEDECTQREIELLQKLKHQNIVRMLELFRESGKLHMVFEYCPQDMLNVLGSYPNGMPEKLVRRYILQMCRALMYVHAKHVIHRDVKPENLLVKGRPEDDDPNENSLKLCDFGVARQVGPYENAQLTGYVSTRWYRAPELVLGNAHQISNRGGGLVRRVKPKWKRYSCPVDVWAVGCVMFELITAKPLFPGKSDVDQLDLIRRYGGIGPGASASGGEKVLRMRCGGKLSEDGFSLMKRMLQMDQDERITCEEALQHRYLAEPSKSKRRGKERSRKKRSSKHGRPAEISTDEDISDDFDDDFEDEGVDKYSDDGFEDEDEAAAAALRRKKKKAAAAAKAEKHRQKEKEEKERKARKQRERKEREEKERLRREKKKKEAERAERIERERRKEAEAAAAAAAAAKEKERIEKERIEK
eukprot:g309.t1